MRDLEEAFERACKDKIIPGAVLAATNRDGSKTYHKAFGVKTLEDGAKEEPLGEDAMLLIASCTKLMTSIAALQCVEKGLIGLDDDVAEKLPELAEQQILTSMKDGKAELTPRKNKITLRLLLTHSTGCAYDGMSATITAYNKSRNHPPFGKTVVDRFAHPLLFEPGTLWSYGTNLDWTGLLIERLTGETLESYMQKNIWKPLGIKDITFYPEKAGMQSRQPALTMRDPQGNGVVVHYGGKTINHGTEAALGGQGAYATMSEYLKILHSILKDDGKLLKHETVEMMFQPQLTKESKASLDKIRKMPEHWQAIVGRFPDEIDLDWGLGGILTTQDTPGWRYEGTLAWSGLPNLFWWIDRKAGICGIFGTQVLPPGDAQTEDMIVLFEKTMYERLSTPESRL